MNTPDSTGSSRDSGQFHLVPGNREAYAALFSRYAPRIKSYMMRRGLTPSAAEELTQEVMLTVWSKAERYDAVRAPVRTWVFTIARNRCIDELRRGLRAEPDPQDPCWVDTLNVPSGPEAHALARGREQALRSAVETLDQAQRETLRSLYFEGKSIAETAAVLGVPTGTIKSRTRRALEALRRHLKDGELDGP